MRLQWNNEKEVIDEIRSLNSELEHSRSLESKYEREGDLNRAAEIKHGRVPQILEQIDKNSQRLEELQVDSQLLREEVTEEDIAHIVSIWTGIPVSKMLSSEMEKLLDLEKILSERVVGQDAAISAVSDAIRRNKTGLSDEARPLGSFIFLGPTGVGKTELAKTLADFLFNDEKALTRIDMSEYMEKHTVSRLIGAPPGYVGYDEGGQLTEAVRRRPYSVILFDEIEKAHPDVFNVLLQLLDDGRLTDGQGRVVDFRNSIIILTSNLGGDLLLEAEEVSDVKDQILEIMKKTFKPEFLNRVDETILFNRLGKGNVRKIVNIQLKRLEARLADRKLELVMDDDVRDYISTEGFDPSYGARPVKRAIQNLIQNPLAKEILAGNIKDGDRIGVSKVESGLKFSVV